jgi:hypothetical protein
MIDEEDIYTHHTTTHARLLSHALTAIIIPRNCMYPLNSVTGPEKQCIMFTHKIRSSNRAMNPESRIRLSQGRAAGVLSLGFVYTVCLLLSRFAA